MEKVELFYVQDNRSTCGNSTSWWAIGDRGYTLDIRCAKVFTLEEVRQRELDKKEKYKVWPKGIIDNYVQHHVDIQDLFHHGKNKDARLNNHPHTIVFWRPDLIGVNHA